MQVRAIIRLGLALCAALPVSSACAAQGPAGDGAAVVLDRVVAVVNNRAILASDVDSAERLSILEPRTRNEKPDARSALQRLISRMLIQEQIRREEEQAAEPTEQEVEARIRELRQQLPACVRANCASDAGWDAFLSAHGLTKEEVDEYFRVRMEVLRFIENRFRQGIRISQEEVETYYKQTLLPEYPAGQPVPSLEAVSKRIEEILLQEQVTKLFSAWLDNLHRQGDVEILDPALETPGSGNAAGQGGGADEHD